MDKLVEEYLFATDKQAFFNKLIQGSEAAYYFRVLEELKNNGCKLTEENKTLLFDYEKLKTKKSKCLFLRYQFECYDSTSNQEEKKKILKAICKDVFDWKYMDEEYEEPPKIETM